ncbi:putative methyltransferase [Morganella phage Mecenats66]|nr:putative methyltransferase [Morganella phage Mecenats66]
MHPANKQILDMCCGSRMFWYDRTDPRVMFCDVRCEEHDIGDGRIVSVRPDVIADFRQLPFPDETFWQVVFDPPHLTRAGKNGWMFKKYGVLNKARWREDLKAGFAEAFRVLKTNGTLVFKWNSTHIQMRQITAILDEIPTVYQRIGKNDNTHWMVFFKGER